MDVPAIKDVMTPMPHTIGVDQTVKTAKEMLAKYDIRHLPVKKGGRLIGILSDRDIHYGLWMDHKEDDELKVKDIVVEELYAVAPETKASEVVSKLADGSIGSALIVDEFGELMGIYTLVDAAKSLNNLYNS